jgi:hypothetical protein
MNLDTVVTHHTPLGTIATFEKALVNVKQSK